MKINLEIETSNQNQILEAIKILQKLIVKENEESPSTNELPISVWTRNVLAAEGITTLSLLLNNSANDLLRIPNFGRKCLIDVRECLAKFNYSLKGE